MSHNVYDEQGKCMASGYDLIKDPGDAGTFDLDPNKGYQRCIVETGGAETRKLPDPTAFAVGFEFYMVFDVDGGTLSVTGEDADEPLDSAGGDTAALADAGDSILWTVTQTAGTKQWRALGNDGATIS